MRTNNDSDEIAAIVRAHCGLTLLLAQQFSKGRKQRVDLDFGVPDHGAAKLLAAKLRHNKGYKVRVDPDPDNPGQFCVQATTPLMEISQSTLPPLLTRTVSEAVSLGCEFHGWGTFGALD